MQRSGYAIGNRDVESTFLDPEPEGGSRNATLVVRPVLVISSQLSTKRCLHIHAHVPYRSNVDLILKLISD